MRWESFRSISSALVLRAIQSGTRGDLSKKKDLFGHREDTIAQAKWLGSCCGTYSELSSEQSATNGIAGQIPPRATIPTDAASSNLYLSGRFDSLADKHSQLERSVKAASVDFQTWKWLDNLTSFMNVIVPSISIVLQGVLKVKDASGSPAEGPLEACGRSFRTGMVALFTIIAIIMQAFTKTVKIGEERGMRKAKLDSLRQELELFEQQLNMVGNSQVLGGSPSGKKEEVE